MHCSGRKIPHGGRYVSHTIPHALLFFIISRHEDPNNNTLKLESIATCFWRVDWTKGAWIIGLLKRSPWILVVI